MPPAFIKVITPSIHKETPYRLLHSRIALVVARFPIHIIKVEPLVQIIITIAKRRQTLFVKRSPFQNLYGFHVTVSFGKFQLN